MFRSIRWTLQWWHAGILSLALASFGTALYVDVSRAQFSRVDSELEGAARVFVNATAAPLGPDFGGRRGGRGGRGGFGGGFGGGGFNGPGGFGGPGGYGGPGGAPGAPGAPANPGAPGNPGSSGGQGGGPGPNGGFGGPGGYGGGPGGFGGGPGGFGGPGAGGGFGGPGGPFVGSPEWWAAIPENVLQRVGENEQDQPYFVVFGYDGRVMRSSSNAAADVPAPDLSQLPPGTNLATAPASFRSRSVGGVDFREVSMQGPFGVHVLVGRSLDSVHKSLLYLRWELLGAGAAVLAIGLVGGWLLSLRATRPIRSISQTARAISASDLSRRIPVEETESELGSLATTLNDTFARLQTAFDRQVRFTADASHELRTPLSVIHSQAELSLSRERSAAEYRQSLETCLRASKRMKSLVESLLVLARADAGKLVLTLENFDLAPAAEECVLMVGPRAAERKVTVESKLASVPLRADRTKIMQLITNLLVNAIQYNREGGKVMLTVTGGEKDVAISVADTGVGMTPEDQAHVFERFFRADKARSRDAGGSGLGLAICQSIAEAHHGTITCSSKLGEGTTFTVRLPISSPV